MKYICPKCNSEMKKGDTSGAYNIPLCVTNDDPMKLFGGEKKSKVSTYICIGCGYIEMYADDYKELFK